MEWKKIAVCNFWTGHSTIKLNMKGYIFQLFMNQIIFAPKNIAYGPVYNFVYSNIILNSVRQHNHFIT